MARTRDLVDKLAWCNYLMKKVEQIADEEPNGLSERMFRKGISIIYNDPLMTGMCNKLLEKYISAMNRQGERLGIK